MTDVGVDIGMHNNTIQKAKFWAKYMGQIVVLF
jgi:hypothetical protein